MRWKRGCQSLNSSLLSYSYPYEKQLITVNHVVSMVTSTDFGLLYYHILSLHQHYNMNIRILYNRTVLLVSPQSKHGNQPKTWDGSVAFQPNLHQVPASTHHQTPRRWLEWHQGSSPVEIQPVVGLEISTFGDVFLPTIHGNISVILDCPEELTRNSPPQSLIDALQCGWTLPGNVDHLSSRKRGLEDNYADPKTTFVWVPC